jgi:hypothetical protein
VCNLPAKLALGFSVVLLAAVSARAQDLTIDWYTIDGGGETFTTGGDLELSGTAGQPDANTTAMTGGDFELAGGFWPGVAVEAEHPCPGDLDGDNDVDLSDLAQLLGNYGTTSGAQYEDGDLDGDGDVDLSDLAELLGHYGETCL